MSWVRPRKKTVFTWLPSLILWLRLDTRTFKIREVSEPIFGKSKTHGVGGLSLMVCLPGVSVNPYLESTVCTVHFLTRRLRLRWVHHPSPEGTSVESWVETPACVKWDRDGGRSNRWKDINETERHGVEGVVTLSLYLSLIGLPNQHS